MEQQYCFENASSVHVHCKKIPNSWVIKSKPLAKYSLSTYIESINKNCLNNIEVETFIADYVKFAPNTIINAEFIKVFYAIPSLDNFLKIFTHFKRNTYFIDEIFSNKKSYEQTFPHIQRQKIMIENITDESFHKCFKNIHSFDKTQIYLDAVVKLIENKPSLMMDYINTRNMSFVNAVKYFQSTPHIIILIAKQWVLSGNLTGYYCHLLKIFEKYPAIFCACFSIITMTNEHLQYCYDSLYCETHYKVPKLIDAMVMNGLTVTKEFALNLASHGKCINNFEKYGIPVDDDFLEIFNKHSFYCYAPSCIPSEKTMISTCMISTSKYDFNEIISYMRRIGGVITKECIKTAIMNSADTSKIEYFIKKHNATFDESYFTKTSAHFFVVSNHYKAKHGYYKQKVKTVTLNENILTNFDKNKKNEKYEKCTTFVLNAQIKKLINYPKNTIMLNELPSKLLEYLIKNKYTIGQYCIISGKFAEILNVKDGIICHINELNNIATYLVRL